MFYDLLYVLPALLLTLIASAHVKSTYARFREVRASSGICAESVARRILDAHGLTHIRIERIAGDLTDHFDPTAGVIRLSESVYGSSSVAAIGVAAHECGHAVQYAQSYAPMRVRASIIPVTNFASRFAVPMVLIGMLLAAYGEMMLAVAYAGVILFGFCVLFQLVTLPVEFNASRRAMSVLREESILSADELGGAKKVLSAAAMTYVASLAGTLLQLLRLISVVNNSRRR